MNQAQALIRRITGNFGATAHVSGNRQSGVQPTDMGAAQAFVACPSSVQVLAFYVITTGIAFGSISLMSYVTVRLSLSWVVKPMLPMTDMTADAFNSLRPG